MSHDRFYHPQIYWIEPGLSPRMGEVVKQSLAAAGPGLEYIDRAGNVVQSPGELRGKQLGMRCKDSTTGEVVETESLHAHVLGSRETREKLSKAQDRA